MTIQLPDGMTPIYKTTDQEPKSEPKSEFAKSFGHFDLNAGIIKRSLGPSVDAGYIVMKVSEPGVYYKMNGELATDEQAIRAGFDLTRDRIQLRRKKLMQEAADRIAKEAEAALAAAEADIDADDEAPTGLEGVVHIDRAVK